MNNKIKALFVAGALSLLGLVFLAQATVAQLMPGNRAQRLSPGSECVYRLAPATLVDQQPNFLLCDSKGNLSTVIRDAAGNARGVNVSAGNALIVDGSSSTQPVSGTVAVTATNLSTNVAQINGVTPLMGNGATGTGSPRVTPANDSTGIANWGHGATGATAPTGATQQGCRGVSAEQTAVTTGQMVGTSCDLVGKQIVLPYANPENSLIGLTSAMTGTASTAVSGMGAQGAGVRVYATACTFSNSHATVGTMMLLQDGSGGTTLWQAPAASLYGGAHTVFPTPIKTTANTGLFVVNATTGSNTFVACTGYKGI